MKVKTYLDIITPLTEELERDNDGYLMIHFSREDNRYEAYHEGIDQFDAIIVIEELVKRFNINRIALLNMLHEQRTTTS